MPPTRPPHYAARRPRRAMPMHPIPLASLLFAGVLSAQTFVVDANGGPGASFTSLAVACATVPSGAVLDVRPGSYDPFVVSGKALTILGQPGVVVVGPWFGLTSVVIQNTASAQTVVLRDLTLRSSFGGPLRLDCTGCAGPVLLTDIALDQSFYAGVDKLLTVQNCAQLAMNACGPFFVPPNAPRAAIEVVGSDVVLRDCPTDTVLGCCLRATNATVQLVDATHVGGGAVPVVELLNAQLRVLGNSLLQAQAALSTFTVLAGNGTAIVDASTTRIGLVTSGVTVTTAPQPVVRATGGRLGTLAQATMGGPPGQLGALFLGALGPRQTIPGIAHAAWLAAGQFAAGPVGVFGPPLAASVSVPNVPALLGSVFVWQGVAFGGATGFTLSNPSCFTP